MGKKVKQILCDPFIGLCENWILKERVSKNFNHLLSEQCSVWNLGLDLIWLDLPDLPDLPARLHLSVPVIDLVVKPVERNGKWPGEYSARCSAVKFTTSQCTANCSLQCMGGHFGTSEWITVLLCRVPNYGAAQCRGRVAQVVQSCSAKHVPGSPSLSNKFCYLRYKLAFSKEETCLLDKSCNSLRHFWGRSLLHIKSPSGLGQPWHFIANAHTHTGRGRWLGQLEWRQIVQYYIAIFHKRVG